VSLRKSDPQVSKFRLWLILRLKETSWVRFQDDTIFDVSKRIGVREDLLLEAKRSFEEDCRRRGKTPHQPSPFDWDEGVRTGKTRKVEVVLPREVYLDWKANPMVRNLPPRAMLRSLVHKLLMSPRQPSHVSCRCIYRGKPLPVSSARHNGRGHLENSVETTLSVGAYAALRLRSQHFNCTISALLRGVILDFLQGKTRDVTPVYSALDMWDNPNMYWNGART
jgi:hypothetical protein